MLGIKFNCLTKEIELKGSESFIESNFNKIQDLLVESFGVRKKMIAPRKAKINQEPVTVIKEQESQINAETKGQESPVCPVITSAMSVNAHEIKATRPPLRKYIRKVGTPGHERTVVEIVEQKTEAISLESLREKFGLSESKMGGIIRDAEKFGKVKRVMNGSYAWT